MYINDLIKEFKLDLEMSNCSSQTVRTYISSLNLFARYISDVLSITEVESISNSHVKAYQKFNKERGLKQKTLNMHVSPLRKIFSYLID